MKSNSILNSGAGKSVMDLGTFENLGLDVKIEDIKECDDVLRDA